MSQDEGRQPLLALEHLMDEFFAHTTTNVRKAAIEEQLNNFSSQRDSWKLCVYFLKHTSSQYVSMYALSTIEAVINREWNSLDWEHRVQLKGSLYEFFTEQDNTAPNFIRNKLAKLLVDIARHDWPHFYPEFFTNITQLLESENGQLLGLILLRTTSEELMSPRPDLTTIRKEELTRLLQQHIPQVFQTLTSILNGLGNKRRHNTTATPPPSPTHPSSLPNLVQQISVASFRPDNKAITREVLATLQHLFTWADLSHVPVLIDDDDMCVLAMSTLNELLYRKCIPPGSQDLFIQLYHHTVLLLRDISCPASGKIETLGPDFTEKLSELLALLIEQHLARLESEPGFSALEFLGLLYQLTMQLPSAPCYLRCLGVWAAFIKQIKPQNAQKYSEALLGLVLAVLNKMQFNCNAVQLLDISNEEKSDNNESEWQIFQKTSIEIIAMIAEFAPLETFTRVITPWKVVNDVYVMLENTVDIKSCCLNLEHSETQRLHYILRDLSSLTQMLARLSLFFIDQDTDYFQQASPIIDNLLTKLLQSASLATNTRFYHFKMNDNKLTEVFTEVHSQILAALKTWWSWLNPGPEFNMKDMNTLLETSLPILRSSSQDPAPVVHASAHLLLSVAATVHPPNLILLPSIVDFIQVAPNLTFCNRQSKEVVLCALSAILVKPWGELSQTDSNRRNQLIVLFFDGIVRNFKEINHFTDACRVKDVCNDILPCLSSILEYSKNFPLNSKKLLFMALKGTIEHALIVLPHFVEYNDVGEHLLVFFLNALSVLQPQMGVQFVKHAVEVFLNVAVREQNRRDFTALDKLLQILQLVVEAPGSAYKTFLPGILELCLKNIVPSVITEAGDNPDILIALLKLLHSVLLNRWNYFFTSQIRLGNSPGCSELEPWPDNPLQPAQLLEVLKIFGQALLQSDINTFRTSLEALENLNTKWKLYHKGLFREQLLSPFLTVLLQTLLVKSHNLLTDDILLALYNMAAVNFEAFFTTFLQQFLENTQGLTNQQKHTLKENFTQEIDMPTFVMHLQRFTNDLRCHRLCNDSLPAGSVVL